MYTLSAAESDDAGRAAPKSRPVRADAQRNIDALLEAALAVFATSGVDAPVREIAEKAGVGIGTLYRHFPQRSNLIVAVFRQQVDACADAAADLVAKHTPGEALALWLQRYADFIATKPALQPPCTRATRHTARCRATSIHDCGPRCRDCSMQR